MAASSTSTGSVFFIVVIDSWSVLDSIILIVGLVVGVDVCSWILLIGIVVRFVWHGFTFGRSVGLVVGHDGWNPYGWRSIDSRLAFNQLTVGFVRVAVMVKR
jgi:hypothetical protein